MPSASAQFNSNQNPTADDELSRLQQDYIEKLPEKIEQITDLWNKLQYVNWNDHAFAVLHRLAHGIAGSGKSFGFAKLSQEAKKLENYIFHFLDTHNQPDAKERKHIDALIESLLVCAKSSSAQDDKPYLAQSTVDFKTQHNNKVIYVVDDDPHISQYLSTVLSNVGYQVRIFANPKMACEYINHLPPDLVILDIMFPQGNLVGIDFVEDIRASAGHRVPIFFISSRTDLKARVNAVRSGGDAYLTKPLDDELLLEKIEDTLASQEQPNCKILIVDDDINLSQYYKLALKKAGFNTHIVNKPVRVIEELEHFNPDLVLLDMYMPEFDGMELASVIRQDDKYIGLPIIFVSAEANQEVHEKAYNLGIDDFVIKPVTGEQLVERVQKRIRRTHKIHQYINKLSKLDHKTHLVNRGFFLEKIEYTLAGSNNNDACSAVIDISIDNAKHIIEQSGYECTDALSQQIANLLLSNISSEDIAAQFSENVYMILASPRNKTELTEFAENLRASVADARIRLNDKSYSLTTSIGVLDVNDSILSIHDLLSKVVDLSQSARDKGANKIAYSADLFSSDNANDAQQTNELILKALEGNQFTLAFQAIINLASHHDEKYETLLRLQGDNGRYFLPQQFLPLAKEHGYIEKIDRWVIEHAIAAIANNSHTRGKSDLFIKVSLATLANQNLLPKISNAINSAAIPGDRRIIFEINEKDIIADTPTVGAFCRRIEKLNCGISIGNFGFSDNALQILNSMPINYVKLQGKTIENVLTDTEKQDKLKKLIDQVLHQKINIIAGTIEDPATLTLLWDLGVRYFQGYFIQHPNFDFDYDFSVPVQHI